MELKSRDTQTQIKHTILEKYLDTWGGIIFRKLSSRAKAAQGQGREYDLHFVYVDCFAYIGRYAGDTLRSSEPVYGSPVIGIRALDKLADAARQIGVSIRVNSILIERDPKTYSALLETLFLAGFEKRVRKTQNFSQLKPGEIAVVNGDSTQLARELVDYTTTGFTWSFYLNDPYGPSGIPHEFVKSIISQQHHDVMINFIYEDLVRKAGLARRQKINAQQQQLVDYWTIVFGDEKWKEIDSEIQGHKAFRDALWDIPLGDMKADDLLDDEQLVILKERRFVDLYRRVLRKMDSKLAVKLVDLRFPERERTMFYLFLTTHDPTGALALNKILFEAKYLEHELRYLTRYARKTAPPPDQLVLFAVEPPPLEIDAPARPPIEDVANSILKSFKGKAVTRRDIYKGMADEIYFAEEVDKAIRQLKKQGKAVFDGTLGHDTVIRFSI